jgi:hypothetical protein
LRNVVVAVEVGALEVVEAGVLALVLLLELLLLPQAATPIKTTARLGMRSLERIEPPGSVLTHGGRDDCTEVV